MKTFLDLRWIVSATLILGALDADAQGCVAVRNMSACALSFDSTASSKWQLSLNYRYFRSFKHFRGDHEEKNRVEDGTQVINNDNSIIIGVSYDINARWSIGLALPFLYIDRSSLYEHYGNSLNSNPEQLRFHTHSVGLGDLRMMSYYKPLNARTRLTLGVGLKLPTGNYHYKDYFHKRASDGSDSLVHKVVDQSIQPGDGGLGIIFEANIFVPVGGKMSVYGYGVYMLNPRNTNGVRRSTSPATIPHGNEFSVSDQFLFRTGAMYMLNSFQAGLGCRVEGIPARDLVGQNDGFRRPGYIISAEPSVLYSSGRNSFRLDLPVALYRNRTRSVYDVQQSIETNTYRHGDAAFADWLISVTYARSF